MFNDDKKALAACHGKRILVIGDVMLDEYHWCNVKRISPEAPVPVCVVDRTTLVPGGAANVAYNVGALSSKAYLLGVIGNDSSGEKLATAVSQGVGVEGHFIRSKTRPTILKSRIIAHHQQVVRVDREDSSPFSPALQRQIYARFESLLPIVDAVILSDYAKGLLTVAFTKKVILACQKQGIPVIVDPKGQDYRKYKGASLLTPNFGEFTQAVKKDLHTEREIFDAGQRLRQRLQLTGLLITRSEKGMSLITSNDRKIDIPTRAKEVADITGAGDTVIATLSIALAAKLPLEMAAHLANAAAGVVVAKVGTASLTLDELAHALDDDERYLTT
jgi:D-beta-D-heptose 7-phosphate kinase/D-beta-D-heptose 1-phosphate adenosyltransferase